MVVLRGILFLFVPRSMRRNRFQVEMAWCVCAAGHDGWKKVLKTLPQIGDDDKSYGRKEQVTFKKAKNWCFGHPRINT